jgi:hypothetical protein
LTFLLEIFEKGQSFLDKTVLLLIYLYLSSPISRKLNDLISWSQNEKVNISRLMCKWFHISFSKESKREWIQRKGHFLEWNCLLKHWKIESKRMSKEIPIIVSEMISQLVHA